VELHSLNISENASIMYPVFVHARSRKSTSRFPGNFPFTLQPKHAFVSNASLPCGISRNPAHLGTGTAPNCLASLAST
jgi:hypothetical protein